MKINKLLDCCVGIPKFIGITKTILDEGFLDTFLDINGKKRQVNLGDMVLDKLGRSFVYTGYEHGWALIEPYNSPVKEEKVVVPKMTNCPNCGAPIKGHKCEYCDTVFDRNAVKYEEVMNKFYSYRTDELEQRLRKAQMDIANANQSAYLLQQMHEMTCNTPTNIRTAILYADNKEYLYTF